MINVYSILTGVNRQITRPIEVLAIAPGFLQTLELWHESAKSPHP
jgi:hypothetical protein